MTSLTKLIIMHALKTEWYQFDIQLYIEQQPLLGVGYTCYILLCMHSSENHY